MSSFFEIHVLLGSLTNKEEQIIVQNDEKKISIYMPCYVMIF
jgi:hypothetical protein